MQTIKTVRRIQANVVDEEAGLNLDYYAKVGSRIMHLVKRLGDAMTERLMSKAIEEGKASLVTEITKKRKKKLEKEQESRQYTVLKSTIIDKIPNVDLDKKLFLKELLKLLGFADMYFKKHEYMAFFNAGLAMAFIAV